MSKGEVEPKRFGERVKRRREELRWSQTRLGKEADYSQTNIGWIEAGNGDPLKYAMRLAEALQTTSDWLLWERGPKETGPRPLTAEQYEELPQDTKLAIADFLKSHQGRQKARA